MSTESEVAPVGAAPSGPEGLSAREAAVRDYILSLGFPPEAIVSHPDRFVVEGCLEFRKDMAVPGADASGPRAKRAQNYVSDWVYPTASRHIKVRLASGLAGEAANLDAALSVLNQTYSRLYFVRTTASDQHILISPLAPGSNPAWTALASWPLSGRPGSSITINTNPDRYMGHDATLRRQVLIHELLHTVGLAHTYGLSSSGDRVAPGGEYFSNTPPWTDPDLFSVMQPGATPVTLQMGVANAISYYDHVAIQNLFPRFRAQRGADINGDGKTDLMLVQPSGAVSFKLSSGAVLGNTISAGTFGDEFGQYFTGDIDGDGRSDLLYAANGTLQMRRSVRINNNTADGFAAPVVIAEDFGWTYREHWLTIGGTYHTLDFNGDGKHDVLFADNANGSVNIRLSTGTALGTDVLTAGFGDPAGQYFVGDFNGDNKEDVFCANRPSNQPNNPAAVGSHTVDILVSGGNYFQFSSQLICGDCFGHISWDGLYFAADFNGDNKDDIYFKENDGRMHVLLSTGSGTGAYIGPSVSLGTLGTEYHVGDFNGDGRWDIYSFPPNGSGRVLRSNGTSMSTTISTLFSSGFGNLTAGDQYF